MHAIIGSHEISQSILTLNPQNFHYVHFITYIFRDAPHFSAESHGNVIFPHKVRESVSVGPQKELIHLVSIISRPTNNHRQILHSPSKIGWMGSQLMKYLKIKAFAFGRTYIC